MKNFNSYSSKSYASVVLSDSVVAIIGERENAVLSISFMIMQNQIFSSILQEVFLLRPAAYLLLIFFHTVSSSSSVYYLSLMSSC